MKWASGERLARVGGRSYSRSSGVCNEMEVVIWREVLFVSVCLRYNFERKQQQQTYGRIAHPTLYHMGRAESTNHAACSSTPGASSNSSSSSLPPSPAPFMPIALRSKLRAEYNHRIPGEEGSSDRRYLPPPPTTLRPDTLPPW